MLLRSTAPRHGWRERVEGLGFSFHSLGCEYWTETEHVELTAEEAERLERAVAELHRIVLEAVDHVVRAKRFEQIGIPVRYGPLIADSWRRADPSLYGRFDLRFDGDGPPRLLEVNGDTPTSLVEAAIVQRDWAESSSLDAAQSNRIETSLVERWREVAGGRRVHLACAADSQEDADTVELLAHTAQRAGLETRLLHIHDIGWSERQGGFVDLDDAPIGALFKLYPWEWMFEEPFAEHLAGCTTRFIEPPWKVIPSSKGILAILWELFPGHPNLLPAHLSADGITAERVVKPLFSREGANVRLETSGEVFAEPGDYGKEGFVYQQASLLPRWGDWYVVTGAWVIGDRPAGLGFRGSKGPITTNQSRFLPHIVVERHGS